MTFTPGFTATFAEQEFYNPKWPEHGHFDAPDGACPICAKTEIFIHSDWPAIVRKTAEAEYETLARVRGHKRVRNAPLHPSIPEFTAPAISKVEKEWLGVTVSFRYANRVSSDGERLSAPPNNDGFEGHVVGLSGHVRGCLSVYVPGDGFYAVRSEEATVVNRP